MPCFGVHHRDMIHLASLESTLEAEVALGCAWNNPTFLSCPVHLNSIMRAIVSNNAVFLCDHSCYNWIAEKSVAYML